MNRFTKALLTAISVAITLPAYTAGNNTNINVSPTERAKIEEVVHQYLLSKPEVIMEAIQILQQKQYEEAKKVVKETQQDASQFANALFHQANDPIAGNPQGKVTIVEFFDYQCPHCINMLPIMDAIIKANPDLRVVFKDFPIRGPISDFAARAALAANKQGKYVEFSHAMLASAANQPLTQESILQTAKNLGLNMEQLKKDMDDSSITNQLKANDKLARDLKLFGTPAFFIARSDSTKTSGISYIPGRMDQKQLQEAIDKASK